MDGFDPDCSRRRVLTALAMAGSAGVGSAVSGQSRAPSMPDATSRHPPSGMVTPRTFGARMDGTSDDAAMLEAAFASGSAVLIDGPLLINRTIDVPPDVCLIGTGVYRATIKLGRSGMLRMAGTGFDRRAGGAVIRDLTIAPVDRAEPGVDLHLRHVEHVLFDNVTFYRINTLLDDHHHVTFRDCRFFGDEDRATVTSQCEAQPAGRVGISESVAFARCFFASCPLVLVDTVDARLSDCTFFSGPFGVRSTRRLARGSDAEPFFMGPSMNGCVFDSIDGLAIDIEGGGTDCRITNNFISAGRTIPASGIRLANCSGMELTGNRFEWCGTDGLVLDHSEKLGVIANSFANMGAGAGIAARGSQAIRVIGNAFENRPRWGGSGSGGTTLAIAGDAGCTGWSVIGNTAVGLRDPRVAVLGAGIVHSNSGWPPATERGWPSGTSDARPAGVADGYRWYDRTIGQWIYWHAPDRRWLNGAGQQI
ncbi:right-handed parallel beta-helix repeat-containing protein [uncultured Sphingomonas sp.]|uniref:right-handed parallel beta-helix repeat-containing protein n=1 Tax=uncultured Sphingomonas sp. TaxID=158754 RepID=UPI00374902E4